MKIIVNCTDKKRIDLINVNICAHIKNNIELEVIHANDLGSTIGYLEMFDDVDAIYSDSIYEEYKKFKIKVIIGNKELLPNEVSDKIINELKELTDSGELADYFPVSIGLFYYFSKAPCDIFIKINDKKYVKFKEKETLFEQIDVKKYEQKEVKCFYVSNIQKEQFLNNLNDRLKDSLEVVKNFKRLSEVQDYIISQVKGSGIDPVLLKIANESANKSVEALNAQKGLKETLNEILTKFNDYKYQHAYMTLIFCNLILKDMSWSNKSHKEDIATVCFLHDISLNDLEEGMKVSTQDELEKSDFDLINKKVIKKHALLSSQILTKHRNISSESLKAIKQHHGDMNGTSFKDDPIDKNLTPITMVFILSEFIANQFLLHSEKNIKSILDKIYDIYGKDTFKNEIISLSKGLKSK